MMEDVGGSSWSAKAQTACLLSVLVAVLYSVYIRALPKPIPGIPHNADSARRLLGDIPNFLELERSGNRIRNFWSDLSRKHNSGIVQFFMGPFTRPKVIVSDFREVQDILLRRSREFDRGSFNSAMWAGVIPNHFICLNTRDHSFPESKRLQRDLMTPNFLHNVSAPSSYAKVLNFIEFWKFKANVANGHPFPAIKDIDSLTADIIFAAALGIEHEESNISLSLENLKTADLVSAGPESPETVYNFPGNKPDHLLEAIQTLGLAIGGATEAPSMPLYWAATNLRPSIRKANETKRRILQMHIDRANKRINEQGQDANLHAAVDYMVSRELAAAHKANRPPVLDSGHFQDMLFGYLLGGQDTTHSVLSFLVKRLGMHPSTQDTLRKHLREAHVDARSEQRNPTQEEILKSQVPYLDAFIEEVLRCNTPSPVIIKETTSDMNILGHVVPKGTELFFPLWGPSIDEPAAPVLEGLRSETSQKYAETTPLDWMASGFPAKEFHVERWLRKNADSDALVFDSRAGPFLTFSLGNRECWGKRLAYLQLRLVTTLLVWNFDFLPLPDVLADEEVIDVLNAKPKTCMVRLQPRNLQ